MVFILVKKQGAGRNICWDLLYGCLEGGIVFIFCHLKMGRLGAFRAHETSLKVLVFGSFLVGKCDSRVYRMYKILIPCA